MMTSSPADSVAMKALYSTCLPPVPTVICLVVYVRPFSRLNLATIASFSLGVPSTAVYLVSPAQIALIAASFTLSGVSKSGSPNDNAITFLPAALRALALAEMAMVAEGLTRERRAARKDIFVPWESTVIVAVQRNYTMMCRALSSIAAQGVVTG